MIDKAEFGRQLISSLIEALERDFTESQAASLATMALYISSFGDYMKAFWDERKDEFMELVTEKKEGAEQSD